MFVGGLAAQEGIAPGLALPVPRFPGLDARAVFWIPALEGGAPAGGWLVLDEDGNGTLSAASLSATGDTCRPAKLMSSTATSIPPSAAVSSTSRSASPTE